MKNSGLRSKLFFLSIVLMILILSPPAESLAKDLPRLVALSEIGESFDGLRVTIFGWVRSAEVKTGRRGSLHLEVVVGEGEHQIMVFTIRPVHNVLNREVIVQGIYHEEGRFAGFEQKHFIVADTIVRNWKEQEKEGKQ